MCHSILVLPFLQDFEVANARVGAERNPLKTEVINNAHELDAAPLEWNIGDVRSLAKISAVTDGSITLGVAVGFRQFVTDQLASKRIHGHKILEEHNAAAIYDEIGQRSLERLFPGLTEDSMAQATLSAGQSGIGFKRARDNAVLAHLGAVIAARQATQFGGSSSWRRASLRSWRPPPPLVSALSTTMSKQRRSCMFTRQHRQQTKPGCKLSRDNRDQAPQTRQLHPWNIPAPPLKRKTAASPRPGRAVSVGRSSKRTDRTRLRRPKDTLLSKGVWQQVTRIEDLSYAQVSHYLDACAAHNYIINVQKRLGNRIWVGDGQRRCCGSFLDPQLEHAETCSNAEATRGRYACVHAIVCGMKLTDPGFTTEPRGLTASGVPGYRRVHGP